MTIDYLDAVHVSDGFSVRHQELKTAHRASGNCQTVTATCRYPGQASGGYAFSRYVLSRDTSLVRVLSEFHAYDIAYIGKLHRVTEMSEKKVTCNFHRITYFGTCHIMKTRIAVRRITSNRWFSVGDFQIFSIDRIWIGSLERVRHDKSISVLTCCAEEGNRVLSLLDRASS